MKENRGMLFSLTVAVVGLLVLLHNAESLRPFGQHHRILRSSVGTTSRSFPLAYPLLLSPKVGDVLIAEVEDFVGTIRDPAVSFSVSLHIVNDECCINTISHFFDYCTD